MTPVSLILLKIPLMKSGSVFGRRILIYGKEIQFFDFLELIEFYRALSNFYSQLKCSPKAFSIQDYVRQVNLFVSILVYSSLFDKDIIPYYAILTK